jgi:hypothetical protein
LQKLKGKENIEEEEEEEYSYDEEDLSDDVEDNDENDCNHPKNDSISRKKPHFIPLVTK